ncbi:unnamed protein product [Vicia faba]|uniref:Uncharacterized protein n=1 Tax=Vicia faba TaxID=3906 RepID=A0AAV1AZ84_VICFA|nr:unnamed protein product [Vicia faba]
MGLVEESGAGEGNGPGRWKTQTQEEETQILKRKKPKKDGRGRNGFWKLSDGDEGRKDDRWVERRFDDRDDDCGCTQGRVLIWLVAHTHQLATIRKSCCTGSSIDLSGRRRTVVLELKKVMVMIAERRWKIDGDKVDRERMKVKGLTICRLDYAEWDYAEWDYAE